jgi:transcriptional regulator with XRE-family HTH domain
MSQTDLAKAIKKTPAAISRIESGSMNGSPRTIKDIATFLKIPMRELILEKSLAPSSFNAA